MIDLRETGTVDKLDRVLWLLHAVDAAVESTSMEEESRKSGIVTVLGDAMCELNEARNELDRHITASRTDA